MSDSKSLIAVKYDRKKLESELADFSELLKKETLSEEKDILPFFKSRHQLILMMGTLYSSQNPTHVCPEYGFQGYFRSDAIIVDKNKETICLVEYEDARADSVFYNNEKQMETWAKRFEAGFSQLVDWYWNLEDLKKTDKIVSMFDFSEVKCLTGILVIGKDSHLSKIQKRRLEWRKNNVSILNKSIICISFDELFRDITDRLYWSTSESNYTEYKEEVID